MLSIYFLNKGRRNYLRENVNYTIGTITSLRYGAKTPNQYKYSFYVGDKIQESSKPIVNDLALKDDSIPKSYVGNKFLIKYSIEKPKYG